MISLKDIDHLLLFVLKHEREGNKKLSQKARQIAGINHMLNTLDSSKEHLQSDALNFDTEV